MGEMVQGVRAKLNAMYNIFFSYSVVHLVAIVSVGVRAKRK